MLPLAARRHPVVTEVGRALASRCHVPAGSPLLLGVSGGADSVALLVACVALARRREPPCGPVRVLHVNHNLRGRAADEDAAFVLDLCASLGVEAAVEDVHPRRATGNLADRARSMRYRALARAASRAGIGYVAVAHHADDQLETILIALARGAGPAGLDGMAWRRPIISISSNISIISIMARRDVRSHALAPDKAGATGTAGAIGATGATGATVATGATGATGAADATAATGATGAVELDLIRPLLHVRHRECEDLCRAAGIAWREDATNLDPDAGGPRARLRREVVPALEAIWPDVARRVALGAEAMSAAARAFDEHLDRNAGPPERCCWPRAALAALSAAEIAAVLRRSALRALPSNADRLGHRKLFAAAERIREEDPRPCHFDWPGGLSLEITARVVRLASGTVPA